MKKTALSSFTLLFISILSLIVVFILFSFVFKEDYVLLSSKLNGEKVVTILQLLRKNKIEFKVSKNGTSIMVLKQNLEKAQSILEGGALNASKVVGYEIFDKQKFGTTSAIQNINKQRAIEGELVRTIQHISAVDKCRVHLSIPKKNPFIKANKKEARASVVLRLKKGYKVGSFQVKSIQSIVASAVQGLSPLNVIVVDTSGRQLSGKDYSFSDHTLKKSDLEQKISYEKDIEKKLVFILSKILPKDSFKVSVIMDMKNILKEKEELSLVVRSNAINNIIAYKLKKNQYKKKENPIRSDRIIEFKNLSVSVMVDDFYIIDEKKSASKNGVSLSKIKSIIRSTIGLEKIKNPNIQIKTFSSRTALKAVKKNKEALVQKAIYYLGIFTAIILSLLFSFLFLKAIFLFISKIFRFEKEEFIPKTLKELEAEHGGEDLYNKSLQSKKSSFTNMKAHTISNFEDITHLHDNYLRKILYNIPNEIISTAIKTSVKDLRNKILRNLSKDKAALVRISMENSKVKKLYDVENCQNEILSFIKNQTYSEALDEKRERWKAYFSKSGTC